MVVAKVKKAKKEEWKAYTKERKRVEKLVKQATDEALKRHQKH